MTNRLYPVCLLAIALSASYSCGNAQAANTPENINSQSESSQTGLPSGETHTKQTFRPGTWLLKGKDAVALYFFDTDGASGRTVSLETGTGTGYTYTISGNSVLFHMGSSDDQTNAAVTFADSSDAEITWENGKKERLYFISEKGSDEFRFYSNQELCDMAVSYYTNTTGEDAPEAAADLEPETVTVQLYRNLGDHNSTCAWYRVNRFTGKGTDVNTGQEINLASSREENTSDGNSIRPISSTVDLNCPGDCTLAVSFQKGDAFVDDTGTMQLKVRVYAYDLFDMVDISLLKTGDQITICRQDVKVTSLERSETGTVVINGGPDNGGYELMSDDTTVFYAVGANDTKLYYELGEALLPVSSDFIFEDSSDLEKGTRIYYPGDFLTEHGGIEYNFVPFNTTIRLKDRYVIRMQRVYTP